MNRLTAAIVSVALFAGCARHAASTSAPVEQPTMNPPTSMPATQAAVPFAKEIAAFEIEDRAHPMPKDAIVFYGSSSFVKWKSLATDFPGLPVVNRGFGGSQMDHALMHLDRVVIPNKPKTLLIYEGDNDIAAGKTPEHVADGMKQLVANVHAALPETMIYFVSIKPSPSRFARMEKQTKANAMIKAMADADPKLDYIDVVTPMLGADGHPKQELFGPDNLHMNEKGYVLWTSIVGPVISK